MHPVPLRGQDPNPLGFLPGRELARQYYFEVVAPILQVHHPGLVHSAGLLGPGSEVLGFDDPMSADHNWGPRLTLFLAMNDHTRLRDKLWDTLAHELPLEFYGHPTHYEPAPGDPGSLIPVAASSHPINHLLEIATLPTFLQQTIGTDLQDDFGILDWLLTPEQKLRCLSEGPVFHDGLDVLLPMQRKLRYYPHDLWLYLLSAQWQRIGQEEPFVGRAGIVGDDVGSAVIAARLVRDVMRLCLLMERTYAPYPKWFGSAFARLENAPRLTPLLEGALRARDWQERERYLSPAYEIVAEMHNALGITSQMPVKVSQFHDRPFLVIQGETFAKAIWNAIEDEEVRSLPFGVGKVDQWVDSTDILSSTPRWGKLGVIYTEQS